MEIKINKTLIIVIVLVLLIGSFFIGKVVSGIQHRQDSENLSNQLKTALNDTVKYYKVKIDGVEKDVAEKTQLVLTKQQALDAEILTKERYKKLYLKSIESVTQLQAQIKVKDSIITHAPVIYVFDSNGVSIPCAKLPISFKKENKYLKLSGEVDTTALLSFDLQIPVNLDLTIGLKRKGLPSAIVTSDNPYIKIDNIQSLKIQEDKKWYQSGWIKFIGGFGAGVGLCYLVK